MFTLPNFCRVCLKYDKNLIDLAHIENEPSETLLSKLHTVITEVEWDLYKPLLCHPCIKRLNIAYGFKKQCLSSSLVLKNYVDLVKDSQKKGETVKAAKSDGSSPLAPVMILPGNLQNQKYVKIVVGPGQTPANTFQNVFVNLIPTTTLNTVSGTESPKTKDTNQNVFLNAMPKFVPIAPTTSKTNNSNKKIINVNYQEVVTEGKTEELSVELDPLDFSCFEEEEEEDSNEEDPSDYEEVISSSKIEPQTSTPNGVINGRQLHKPIILKKAKPSYVPILPKQDDFINAGQHFLSSSFEAREFPCETCNKVFPSKVHLKHHKKTFHQSSYQCDLCFTNYETQAEVNKCIEQHNLNFETVCEDDLKPSKEGLFICDVCKRTFTSSTGLLRHKVRKHNQRNKKKYFIKGMKNARCDICNREFSTNSYMQQHRKLHLREDAGFNKFKVQGISKFGNDSSLIDNSEEVEYESINVQPDISDIMFREDLSDEEGKQGNNEDDDDDDGGDPEEGEVKMEVEEAKMEAGDSESENEDEVSDE